MEPSLIKRVLNLAVEIQQIAAPTFLEAERAAFVFAAFQEEGLSDLGTDELGNVYARLPGEKPGRPVVVTAHLDSVFPPETDLTVDRGADQISGPGIGDNAVGLASLFGIYWSLQPRGLRFPGDLWLVANVGEEGLGNLQGMRVVVERFGNEPLAYLVLEGMGLGQVYHRALGVRRYRISAETAGGHSWVDYGRPSAIHDLVAVTSRILQLPLPTQPRTTLNVGVFSGGISINTIASSAELELDLRAESLPVLDRLSKQVETIVRAANRPGSVLMAEVIGERPVGGLPEDHPLVALASRSLEAQGIPPCLGIASTDANVPLSLGYPAVCLGLTTGSGAHTQEELIHTRPLVKGLKTVIEVIAGVFSEPGLNGF
ncbi:MAG TPA: M20/M25/M40 family metallo-hydrolase [Anaerolineales bacterium]|nr:M20/M25/M40 family metallo-hydrolase [Anaerolineales bacterium]